MKANKTLKKLTITGKNIKMTFAAMAVMALMASGCDSEEESSYDLTVGWTINGFNVCKTPLPEDQFAQNEIKFDTVEINIYEDETETKAVQQAKIVPCEDYKLAIDRLPRDTYYITVDAIGLYQGENIPFFHGAQKVSVPKDGDEITVSLAKGTGEIQVEWLFPRTCGVSKAGEIANVVVLVNQKRHKATCGLGGIVIPNVPPDQKNSVSAEALDANDNVLYTAQYIPDTTTTEFTVLPGETYQVNLQFN